MKKKLFYAIFLMIAVLIVSCVKDELVPVEEPEPPQPGELALMHYWHFNNVSGTVESVNADFSVTGGARISYPGTGEGYMDSRTYRPADPVSNLNLRMGQAIDQGAVLRVRNPSAGRILLIEAPSTGFSGLIVTYAIARSRPEVGSQQLFYSPDGGTNWTAVGDVYDAKDMPEWTLVTYDLSGIDIINNNPNLQFKIEFSGPHINNADGNNRFDNFTIDGRSMGESVPEKLTILNVNNGLDPEVGKEFSVSLMVTDANGVPSAVEATTTVTVSLESGTGTLGGTLSGTIAAGSYDLTLTGLTYDTAQEGVKIKASAEGLTEAVSEAFTVRAFYELTLVAAPEGAGVLTGAGTYEAGQEISLNAVPNAGFEFVNWTDAEGEISATPAFIFTMPAESVTLTANFEEIEQVVELIHYWHFNTLSGTVEFVNADFSAVGQGVISYPGTGAGYMDERTHRPADPVSNMNLRMGEEPDQGAVLRVRNPAQGRILLLEVPSTGYKDLVVTFAITRSSEAAADQQFYYSADGGTSWVQASDVFTAPDVPGWDLITIDLSDAPEVNNNADLQFKIEYVGDAAQNPSGNNRYDNITLDGTPLR